MDEGIGYLGIWMGNTYRYGCGDGIPKVRGGITKGMGGGNGILKDMSVILDS